MAETLRDGRALADTGVASAGSGGYAGSRRVSDVYITAYVHIRRKCKKLNVPAVRSTVPILTIARRLVVVCLALTRRVNPNCRLDKLRLPYSYGKKHASDCAHEYYVAGGPDH